MLTGRHIVLGVSGGIAAYKAATLARRLMDAGAELRVVMTEGATKFVGAATFGGLTGHHPVVSLFDDPESVSPHTDLAKWADAIVVAPATATVLGRIASGASGDALGATILAFEGPLLVAPAMHTEMWEQPATQANMAVLVERGVVVVGPAAGALAGGDEGVGRMVEPEEIVAATEELFPTPLAGMSVVVSAGGTREPIDPVRFIGNRSSGKMGHAIAEEAARLGASVMLVTTSDLPARGVELIEVETAAEMAEAVTKAASGADVAVLAAAVADFRPAEAGGSKLRRADGMPELILESTPDILASVAAMDPRPFLVGFAAEVGTRDASEKAASKGADLLVANDVAEAGSGFGTDTNRVRLIWPNGDFEDWPQLPKSEVAARLWDVIGPRLRRLGDS